MEWLLATPQEKVRTSHLTLFKPWWKGFLRYFSQNKIGSLWKGWTSSWKSTWTRNQGIGFRTGDVAQKVAQKRACLATGSFPNTMKGKRLGSCHFADATLDELLHLSCLCFDIGKMGGGAEFWLILMGGWEKYFVIIMRFAMIYQGPLLVTLGHCRSWGRLCRRTRGLQ
jgi:hypothetical protein